MRDDFSNTIFDVLIKDQFQDIRNSVEEPLRHIQLTKYEASILAFLIKSMQLSSVLELGTFAGYSAAWMAKATPGEVITIEKDNQRVKLAKKNFKKFKLNNIEIKEGNAIEVIRRLKKKFDMIFIDADKINYLTYFENILPIIDTGIIVFDNIFLNNEVFDISYSKKWSKKCIENMQQLLEKIHKLPYCTTMNIPTKQGMSIVYVKK